MATSYANVNITDAWVDITVANTALINVPVVVQNKSPTNSVYVFFGGASAPTSLINGALLQYSESVDGTSANIWVRADPKGALIYTALKDA